MRIPNPWSLRSNLKRAKRVREGINDCFRGDRNVLLRFYANRRFAQEAPDHIGAAIVCSFVLVMSCKLIGFPEPSIFWDKIVLPIIALFSLISIAFCILVVIYGMFIAPRILEELEQEHPRESEIFQHIWNQVNRP